MTEESVAEYNLSRAEMTSVKECITNYVGYVLGGSGAMVIGFSALDAKVGDQIGLAYPALLISLLISLVLLILYYKFASHNRYAGYCKLLDHEISHQPPVAGQPQRFTWETCLVSLRGADYKSKILVDILNSAKFTGPTKTIILDKIRHYMHRQPFWWEFLAGLMFLFPTWITGKKTESWGFPPYIVFVFLVLWIGFLGVYGYCIFSPASAAQIQGSTASTDLATVRLSYGTQAKGNTTSTDSTVWDEQPPFLKMASAVIILVEMALWFMFCQRLYRLMSSSMTIEAFYWRFLPIRASILNKSWITPHYQ